MVVNNLFDEKSLLNVNKETFSSLWPHSDKDLRGK